MRERSGTRTEHAHRRIPVYVIAVTILVGAGLSVPPSSAARVRPAPGGHVGAPAPVPGGASRVSDGSSSDTDVDELDLARVPDDGSDPQEPQVVARLRGRADRDFALVGVTWRPGTAPDDVQVQVRTEDAQGWSAWQELHFDASEGPAPDEEDGVIREGTEPLWVGDGDGVDARILSDSETAPADPELTLVDPGAYPAPPGGQDAGVASASPAVLAGRVDATSATTVSASAPKIVSRRGWGADPALKDPCDAPRRAPTVQMAFVHHTAGSNDYTRAESPAIVRSIYAYHTQGNGWCDIGYNFLVDRFGTVYEGRAGGVNTPVRGAHTGDYNVKTVGVSLMGNFEKTAPSRAMKRGLTRLLAWKLSSYYRYPQTKTRIAGHRFEKISGHRDAMSTACPGRYAYAFLPALRRRVARVAGNIETPISRKWQALRTNGVNLGQPFRGEADSFHTGRKTQFGGGWIFWNNRPGAHAVRGHIYDRYRAWGLAAGRLGYPRTDAWPIRGHRGTGQAFQRGRIYRTPAHGAVAVWGRIDGRYGRTGLADGRIGVPVRNQYRIRRGWAAGFEHGRITWNTTTGQTTVRYY
jgi:hypothetical protein